MLKSLEATNIFFCTYPDYLMLKVLDVNGKKISCSRLFFVPFYFLMLESVNCCDGFERGLEMWKSGNRPRRLGWPTCVLVCFSWLLNHVICLKMKKKLLFLQAEQIHKMGRIIHSKWSWVKNVVILSVKKVNLLLTTVFFFGSLR